MTETPRMVTLREIAERMAMDRSHARRWIKNRGYTFRNTRDPVAGNQVVAALPENEAEVKP